MKIHFAILLFKNNKFSNYYSFKISNILPGQIVVKIAIYMQNGKGINQYRLLQWQFENLYKLLTNFSKVNNDDLYC